ncbi:MULTISPECIES: hypothetical protein [unclassified Chelatococcus]|uniref:hypothetical protein n=1 Tax=unclassified Chelatococcus TaxID=2638111 RepID=UPI001BCD48EA|nr:MULTISPECIES: hypothetical protein [unclassified Chelatococcus]MBS7696907.1 hypothetical protein [Chelatococcus sp. YT9]MBX3555897.1 hypothetical protein [Chelatococcus sp.]
MRNPALLYLGNSDDARILAQLPLSQMYLTTPRHRRFATFEVDALGLSAVEPGAFSMLGRDATIQVFCRQTACGRDILARHLFQEERPDGQPADDRAISASEFTDFLEALRPPMPFTIVFPPGFAPVGRLLLRYHLTAGGKRVTCLFDDQRWLAEPRGALRDLL